MPVAHGFTAGFPSCHPPNDSSSDGTTSVFKVTPSQPHHMIAAVAGLPGEIIVDPTTTKEALHAPRPFAATLAAASLLTTLHLICMAVAQGFTAGCLFIQQQNWGKPSTLCREC